MGTLTDDMKRVVLEQRLGFVATVTPNGTPNLSPKGTLTVWDDDHLIFADIHSPGTVANLRHNPAIEINVVDPLVRKGYRFQGRAQVLQEGPRFEEYIEFYREWGVSGQIQSIVVVRVEQAAPVVSPVYDQGRSEEQVRAMWERYHAALKRGKSEPPVGE